MKRTNKVALFFDMRKKLLIAVVLVILCGSMGVGIYLYFVHPLKKQADSDHDEVLDMLTGDDDISAALENIDDSDVLRTVREDWLKSMSGDADIDEALQHVKKINLNKITTKDVEKAIQCGDLEILKEIRRSGFSKWDNRKFVLRAANAPFADIMKFLAENGADLDVTDDEGNSVIYLAARRGNVETARFLAGWIGDLRDVPVSQFPYLKDVVNFLTLDGVRSMMDIAITKKKAEGENLRSKKTRRALFFEFSKSITMERRSPQPGGYAEFQKIALAEVEVKLDLRRKRREITEAAEASFPLYKLRDRVKIGRRAGSGVVYISGRLEKITPKYIVVSQQTIYLMDISEREQSKFIPKLNSRYRREYISSEMEEYKKEETSYIKERWTKYLRTARTNGYYYDKKRKIFIHASDIFKEELHRSLEQ